jgi:hypothetical protein
VDNLGGTCVIIPTGVLQSVAFNFIQTYPINCTLDSRTVG